MLGATALSPGAKMIETVPIATELSKIRLSATIERRDRLLEAIGWKSSADQRMDIAPA
ncbi:hypothetical protein BwSF19_63340 [Bradyrhizobium ottawaense]|nr:hypothetical protein BwSF19_63340 [Bradyrhizobium ottawaense]